MWETPWFSATEGMSAPVREAFDTVLKGEAVRLEMRLRLPIGERDFDFGMRPVLDRHGNITGAVPEAVDITERRRGEEALRQSQKMEAIGQLTGGVAHDFNNLLTIIRSATDFLRRRELPEERRRRYVDAISDTVERASKLTAPAAGVRAPAAAEAADLQRRQPGRGRRRNWSGRWSAAASRSRSRFTMPTASRSPTSRQFETALINLAINARDAMDGEGRLTIGVPQGRRASRACARNRRAAATIVAISVADTGSGIAPEHRARSSSRSSPPRRSARAPASA